MYECVCGLSMRTLVSLAIVLQRPRHFESRFQNVVGGAGASPRFALLDDDGHHDLGVSSGGHSHEPAVVDGLACFCGARLARDLDA